jgi:hypothetical protein
MPRNSRKSSTEPNPLYALAGAGDFAVEKIRELSKMASRTISSLEATDPAMVSDRVQERIERRADALAAALRTASLDLRIQARDLTERAQAALQMAMIQAGSTYDALSERGKDAVMRIRSMQNGGSRQVSRGRTTKRSTKPATRKRTTAKRGSSGTARKSTTRSTSGSRSSSASRQRSNSTSASKSTSTSPSTMASSEV